MDIAVIEQRIKQLIERNQHLEKENTQLKEQHQHMSHAVKQVLNRLKIAREAL